MASFVCRLLGLSEPNPLKLEDLPRDMLFEISKHLDTRTGLNVSQTSKGLNSQLKQLQIWQYIALEKGLIVPDDVSINEIIDRFKERELKIWQYRALRKDLIVPDDVSINEIKDRIKEQYELKFWQSDLGLQDSRLSINEIIDRVKKETEAGIEKCIVRTGLVVYACGVFQMGYVYYTKGEHIEKAFKYYSLVGLGALGVCNFIVKKALSRICMKYKESSCDILYKYK